MLLPTDYPEQVPVPVVTTQFVHAGVERKTLEIDSIVDWYLFMIAQLVRALTRKAKGPGSSPGPG